MSEVSHDHTAMLDPTWRPDWDAYFVGIARAVAARADCRRAKFGAVIVDRDRRIVSTGYNGAPSGAGSCLAGDCPRGLMTREEVASHADGNHDFSNCISLHAEMNAVAYAGRVPGGKIYIASLDRPPPISPCDMCAKVIRAAGIEEVIT